MMKLLKHKKVWTVLFAALLAVMLLSGMVVCAAYSYSPQEVSLDVQHTFVTTDTTVDSDFHYIVSARDGAPMPAEADENGVFTFRAAAGTATRNGNSTTFVLTQPLTFTFSQPGVYVYELKADKAQDGAKKNADRYTLDDQVLTLSIYIENDADSESGLKLAMVTVENAEGVKPNDLAFRTAYKGPAVTPTPSPQPTPKPTPTPKPNPNTPRTGDDLNLPLLIAVTVVSGAVLLGTFLVKEKEGSEDHA